MPFERPSLATLRRRAEADIASRLEGADARLRGSVEQVLASVLAGAAHGLHGHLAWLADQTVPGPKTEAEYLDRHAGVWGLERKAPAAASGPVRFPASTGAVLPAGAVVRRADGATAVVSTDATGTGGYVTATVVASVPGLAGNTPYGSVVTLQSPVAGVNSSGTIHTGGLVDGAPQESDSDLLARLFARIQAAPRGGGPGDYVAWALEVAGVTRAWEVPAGLGLGTVVVLFVTDDDDAGIIPGPTKVAEVQAYLDARAPMTADVTVLAPNEYPVDLTIEITPDTPAVRAAVEASLAAAIASDAVPGALVLRSHLTAAISAAAGETDHVLTSPAANVDPGATGLPILGTITWS